MVPCPKVTFCPLILPHSSCLQLSTSWTGGDDTKTISLSSSPFPHHPHAACILAPVHSIPIPLPADSCASACIYKGFSVTPRSNKEIRILLDGPRQLTRNAWRLSVPLPFSCLYSACNTRSVFVLPSPPFQPWIMTTTSPFFSKPALTPCSIPYRRRASIFS